MKKKYQVFISSTYKDLIEERKKVRDVILSMYHFPIGMEMFNAADEEQWEIIKETIDSSDYYVLIIGKRYGSIIPDGRPDAGMSYTEKEYRYAVTQGIPVLAFIKNDSAITADMIDTEPDMMAKLRAFVAEVTSRRETDWFENVDELGTKVTLALHKQMDRKKRPGWVRGDGFDVDASLNEMIMLNQQIRELTKENEKLKELSTARKPVLNVSIQFAGTIDEPLEIGKEDAEDAFESDASDTEELSATETVYRQKVYEKGYLHSTEFLTLDDVPREVRGRVTQQMLDDYNSKLPGQEIVDEYEKNMWTYNEVRKNGQRFNFIISNDGTAKATDINITLEFPKSFAIMKRSEAEHLSSPKKPEMPANPIDKALTQNAIEQSGDPFLQMLRKMENLYEGVNYELPKPLRISEALLAQDYSPNLSFDINGKNVDIWCHDLLHTYTQTIDGLCIIPMEKGHFTIKVSKMCEEYIQPEESELEIIVE